ncbi:MAG: 50S ribosome-binding GTPase, partial [Planctomycetaceae bacterium]|nr:50S ribosome-binding GTPase [Planctomycetaceae bacterium]
KRKLGIVERRRERLVAVRNEKFTVSLVGYTNAGKSTLMQALTGEDVYIADQLFATLDTKTRKWSIPNGGDIMLSDTVGFVRDLPHHLVASFKSTLEEALQADLLLHVVDAGSPEAMQHIETVDKVLKEIGAGDKETLLILNKIDRLPELALNSSEDTDELVDEEPEISPNELVESGSGLTHSSEQTDDRSWYDILRNKYRDSISVSAVTGEGVEALQAAVIERMSKSYEWVDITAHAGDGKLSSYLARSVQVEKTTYNDSDATYRCRLPLNTLQRLQQEYEITVKLVDGDSVSESEKVAGAP